VTLPNYLVVAAVLTSRQRHVGEPWADFQAGQATVSGVLKTKCFVY